MSNWKSLRNKIIASEFYYRPAYIAVLVALALLFSALDLEIAAAIVFVLWISFLLFFTEDTMATALPFLVLCVVMTKCYDSYATFIRFAPFAVVPVTAVIFHLVKYRKPLHIGKSFFGIVAVAIAVTLGGIGRLTWAEYTKPAALYSVFGLGLGMVLLYLILKSRYTYDNAQQSREAAERFAAAMYWMGVTALGVVLILYLKNITIVFQDKNFLLFPSRNNFATYLMFALPFPCFFALKNRLHLISFFLLYGSLLMTASRGGLIFGTVEFLFCLCYLFFSAKEHRLFFRVTVFVTLGVGVALAVPLLSLYGGRISEESGTLVSATEARFQLMMRSFRDFSTSPIVGQGLAYLGNVDIYMPKNGALCWYHMMIPQIIGSMGIVGILAYGYQIFGRFRIVFRHRKNALFLCFGLSYIGIFLMSQVNPGEFCPIPYEMLTVWLFVFMEEDRTIGEIPQNGTVSSV